MEYRKVIETLRIMASKSKVANDVFHDFAARERARNQLTVDTLYYRMKAGGFNYSKDDCRDVIKGLGSLGIGTLKMSKTGNVIALVDIKHTLQSIGKAAIAERASAPKLDSLAKRNKYSPIPVAKETPVFVDPPAPPKPAPIAKRAVLGTLLGASKLVEDILRSKEISQDKKIDAVLALISPEKSA